MKYTISKTTVPFLSTLKQRELTWSGTRISNILIATRKREKERKVRIFPP